MRLIALIAALTIPSASFAGHAKLQTAPVWTYDDGSTMTAALYVYQSGCVRSGQYERPPVSSPDQNITLEGLPDTGRCWFVVQAMDARGERSRPTNEVAYDYTAQDIVPPTPVAAPTVTWTPAPPASSWTEGFNFRFSANFTTDGANETRVLAADAFPVTRNGATFGWSGAIETRDRSSSVDRRLVGQHQVVSGGAIATREFRVTLPAPGQYRIRLAAGDAGAANMAFFEIRDGATVVYTQAERALNPGQFVDAGGVTHASAAQWVSNHAGRTLTFATTDFRFALKRPSSRSSVIAHLALERLP